MSDALMDYVVVKSLQARVADQLVERQQRRAARDQPPLSQEDERQLALSLMQDAVSHHMETRLTMGGELPNGDYDARLVEAIDNAMYKAGELQELLDEDLIENIDINGCDEVWVTYADERGKVRGRPVTATDEDLVVLLQTLASYAGINARPFTPAHPELDVRLPDGSRLSAVMSASERPAASIRRNRYPQMFMPMLVDLGTVSPQVSAFLGAAVRGRANIMLAGATDSGKTTTARGLINCIPPEERIIVVERALELGLRRHPELHPDVLELEEVLPDQDGNGGLTMRQLVHRTRRMNPTRVLLGEVMGAESVELLQAMSQGNKGSISTIHAQSAEDVFNRLATYAAIYDQVPFDVTHALAASAVDFIVYIEKNRRAGGRRCVTEILEVTGYFDGKPKYSHLFAPSRADGRATRDQEIQISQRWADELRDAGYDDAGAGWASADGWAAGRVG